MEDTLEDYLKATAKPDDSIRISNEIVVTAQVKQQGDARAMKIVEFSIEGKLRPEVFTKCLPFINQSHYQDIVEERAITKLCGYALCGKRIPDMPKKQYFISTKSNKVYDITDRKNYCSNFCYKASLHVKKQIDNSPLWLRKLEDIPEYTLLHSSQGGLPGEFVDQGVVKPVKDDLNFTSINAFAEASLDKMTENKKDKRVLKKTIRLKSTMQTISENDQEEEICIKESATNREKNKKPIKVSKKICVISLPSIEENEEKLQNCDMKVTSDDKKTQDIEGIVKKAVEDWITLDTCIFLHGEEKVKYILNERKLSDYFDKLHIKELQKEQQMKYVEICRRLHLQQMADEKFDETVVGGQKMKPVPDFQKLKEDTKDMKLKVKAFYTGTVYEKEDSNFPAQVNLKAKENESDNEGPPAVLPPVDLNSRNMLRRNIFLTSLSKAIQQLLPTIGISYSSVFPDVQALVKTFNLKANNITFKPLVWNYIVLVVLHLLSLGDETLKESINEKRFQEYSKMLMEKLPNGHMFLDDLLRNVSNVDVFVERYITKDYNE
ncbi:hypothetical protein ABEB36_001173 [Hypothenemus hampei]|uniref:RNA polymerase II subunit B1 CTD phosphatase RPAP2 homolog n=1 Tax=Hypothenemus hampei TaxID=57062 RepID=A0ABD1FGZ2_HYPHA